MILKVPAVVKSEERIWAVSSVELLKVVALSDPLNWTTEVVIKFEPSTVRINCTSPTVLDVGKIPVVIGIGLFTNANIAEIVWLAAIPVKV